MKGLILDPACVSCGKYLIFRPKGRDYGLIWFTRTMLVTVHYLLHMQFSPQSNKRTSGAIKPLNPITQTALSHQANCFNWNKELIKAKKYELLALNWATQTLFYAGFLLYYCTACEATADGKWWTICALEHDDKPAETHRRKWCHCTRDECK